jgi:hypothetical protein
MSTVSATNLKHASSASNNIVLDSSGNVGIGTSSPGNKLDIVSSGSSQIRVKDGVTATAYYDFGRDGTDGFFGFSGAQTTFSGYKWSVNAGTEVMRITNGGNVGIGTSSPSQKLHVSGVAILPQVFSGGTANTLELYTGTAFNTSGAAIAIRGSTVGYNNSGMEFYAGGSERARINSSGEFFVNTTTNDTSSRISTRATTGVINGVGVYCTTTVNTGAMVFFNPNGQVGTINVNGSATAYNTSSDYRLKYDVQPMATGLATIKSLKPVTYKWSADNAAGEGFIAHELAEHIPLAVTGEKDAVNDDGSIKAQGVDYSKIVVHLVAAIQELKAEFDAYKAAHP